MRIVVDTNIVFSAILSPKSKIVRILFQKSEVKFYSTNLLLAEIKKHKNKIIKLSSFSDEEFEQISDFINSRITFIDVRIIPRKFYTFAENLTHDVDINDTEFVALAEYIDAKLWTGDKKLKDGLLKKGWDKFISGDQL
jgi:predicted nucleic acid-binding protein